jgi:ferredoxin
MPGNYTPLYGAIAEPKQRRMFDAAAEKVKEIAAAVREGKRAEPETGNFLITWLLSRGVHGMMSRKIRGMDKDFWVNEKCNGCAVCERICPVRNIAMRDGKPAWQHHCEQCMACLQWCPREAIESGRLTPGRKRYRHPDIRPADLMPADRI